MTFDISEVQSAKRLLKQEISERMTQIGMRLAQIEDGLEIDEKPKGYKFAIKEGRVRIAELKGVQKQIDACFQIPDGKEAKE